MKKMNYVLFLIAFIISIPSAQATGCGSGALWIETDRKYLGLKPVLTDHLKVTVQKYASHADISLNNLISVDTKRKISLRAITHPHNLEDVLLEIINSHQAMSLSLIEKTETNSEYDYCEDIPEGETRTYQTYEFTIVLKDGQKVIFKERLY